MYICVYLFIWFHIYDSLGELVGWPTVFKRGPWPPLIHICRRPWHQPVVVLQPTEPVLVSEADFEATPHFTVLFVSNVEKPSMIIFPFYKKFDLYN